MRIIMFILMCIVTLAVPMTVRAQYYSINIDYQTIAAMSEAYSTEAAMEALHNENLQKIYDSYKAAEVASAGIFASKYLDRKALTNMNLWDSEQENKYYTRIYNIVSQRIIPKLIEDAQLMVKDPATALYWGSYLVKTCNDVKSLCNQFESIVTNSTLSFQDIAFVQIANEFAQVFNISNLGGIDWKNFFDHLGDDMEGAFTTDNLKSDLDNLISRGVGLAGAGFNSSVDQLLQGTSFGGSFNDKIGSVITLIDNASDMYDRYKDLPMNKVITTFAGQDNINALFDLSNYNMTHWISDYESAAQGSYYTQRVYIYKVDQGSQNLCDYYPPTDDNSILYGDHWYRIDTKDPNFYPSSAEGLQEIEEKAFGYQNGWWCGSAATELHLPKGLKKIGKNAFAGSGFITDLYLPDGLEEIGELAFAQCNNLETVSIPANCIVGLNAFRQGDQTRWNDNILPAKTSLKTAIFRGKAKFDGHYAVFWGCKNLSTIKYYSTELPDFGTLEADYNAWSSINSTASMGCNTREEGTNVFYVPSDATYTEDDLDYNQKVVFHPDYCGFTLSKTL
ncbi:MULTISPECIES: leucine-rich repeat domain-containing protein [Bacteroidales]|nr:MULTISPECIES: leucine-rich repeat domain-containing protein [Bacteroidales]